MTPKRAATLVGLVALAGLLVAAAYTRVATRSAERDVPPAGQFVAVGDRGDVMHYLRAGAGTPVVMLHGRDGILQEFTYSIFDRVAERYDAIAFDRPGYGYSTWDGVEPLTTRTQARLIHDALARLDVERPILIGHSYGGAVMLQYLLDYPDQVAGAISLAGVAYLDEPPSMGVFGLPLVPVIGPVIAHTLALPLGRLVAARIYDDAFSPATPPDAYVDTVSALYLRPSQLVATAAELAAMHASLQDISPRYPEIATPVTIVFGARDRMLDLERDGRRLHAALPTATLLEVEDAGHKLHHTHPAVVIDALDALAREVRR